MGTQSTDRPTFEPGDTAYIALGVDMHKFDPGTEVEIISHEAGDWYYVRGEYAEGFVGHQVVPVSDLLTAREHRNRDPELVRLGLEVRVLDDLEHVADLLADMDLDDPLVEGAKRVLRGATRRMRRLTGRTTSRNLSPEEIRDGVTRSDLLERPVPATPEEV